MTTIRSALDRYESDLRTRGGDVGNAVRVRRHLTESLLDRAVVGLSINDLRIWRDNLTSKHLRKPGDTRKAPPLTPSGVNRLITSMKAALNLAADLDERITTRRPWEQGLASLRGAEEARNVILPDSEIRRLVAIASSA